MLKIAISGKAGSGKTTLANLIAKEILRLDDSSYHLTAFAAKIKSLTQELFPGCNPEYLYGASEYRSLPVNSDLNSVLDSQFPSFRQINLDIGKLGRSYHPGFWVAHAALEYHKLCNKVKLYILSDLRFIEEYQWVKGMGFLTIRVRRSNAIALDDVSETEQDKLGDDMFDLVIENSKDLNWLHQQLSTSIISHFNRNAVG